LDDRGASWDSEMASSTSGGSDFSAECQEAINTLYHYLDGELTDERRTDVQRHLEGCPPCIKAFQFESQLKILVSRGCRDAVPEDLRQRVTELLAQMSLDDPGEFGGPGAFDGPSAFEGPSAFDGPGLF
jgi:mycothiol system anti-sigma-R factor